MPNYCSNTVVVSGDAAEVAKFNEWLGDGKALLNKINPTPQILVETMSGFYGDDEKQKELEQKEQSNLEQFGYKNWYDWNIGNWGTKWDVDAEIDDFSSCEEQVIMSFQSAWSPPTNAMVSLSEMFPNLTIRHSYLEEGVGFVGVTTIQAGCASDVCHEDSSADVWKEMAQEEFGWEPWPDDEDEMEQIEVTEAIKPAEKPAKKKVKKTAGKKKATKKVAKKKKKKKN